MQKIEFDSTPAPSGGQEEEERQVEVKETADNASVESPKPAVRKGSYDWVGII